MGPPSPSSDSNSNSPTSNRRGSLMPGQSLTELFTRGTPSSAFPLGSTAAVQSSRRRTSITASLGLSGASAGFSGSALGSWGRRRGSSSAVSASDGNGSPFSPGSLEENAVEEEPHQYSNDHGRTRNDSTGGGAEPTTPASPFSRRMSFGTKAYTDLRNQTGDGSGSAFNWNDHSRQRAESMVERGLGGTRMGSGGMRKGPALRVDVQPRPEARVEERAAPPVSMTATPGRRKLDHHEERLLSGDFMMD